MTQRDVILLNKAGLEDEEAAPEEDTEAGKEGKVWKWPLHGACLASGSVFQHSLGHVHVSLANKCQ